MFSTFKWKYRFNKKKKREFINDKQPKAIQMLVLFQNTATLVNQLGIIIYGVTNETKIRRREERIGYTIYLMVFGKIQSVDSWVLSHFVV